MEPTELPAVRESGLIRPVAKPQEVIAYHEEVTRLIQDALKPDVDYGVIPGTGNKPTLLKPGAERLCLAFGASPVYDVVEQEQDHNFVVEYKKKKRQYNNAHANDRTFKEVIEDGVSLGLYRYVISCKLVRSDGRVLGSGLGSCSTMESKYIDRPRDCENTVLKMAQKRALVAATLNAFGLSNRFTQDVEDMSRPKAAPEKYDPTNAQHKQTLNTALVHKKIPEDRRKAISEAMTGHVFDDLDSVIETVEAFRQ